MSLAHLLFGLPAFLILYVAAAFWFLHATSETASGDWWALSRESVGLAPDPARTPEAVVQVYAARAMRWLGRRPFARLPSGTGWQFNAFGVFGIAAGLEEGIEVNLLGLTFGVDFRRVAVKLPLIGVVGLKRGTVTAA